ncbi:hypothetical protein FHS15_003131 [Paenibacillus castaneae]|nr:hypothetical protein [Paenibacillus castaneae]
MRIGYSGARNELDVRVGVTVEYEVTYGLVT